MSASTGLSAVVFGVAVPAVGDDATIAVLGPDGPAVAAAASGAKLEVIADAPGLAGDAADADRAERDFAVVVLAGLVAVSPAPERLLRGVRERGVLAADGQLVLDVPDAEDPGAAAVLARADWAGDPPEGTAAPQPFTAARLGALLEAAGFGIAEIHRAAADAGGAYPARLIVLARPLTEAARIAALTGELAAALTESAQSRARLRALAALIEDERAEHDRLVEDGRRELTRLREDNAKLRTRAGTATAEATRAAAEATALRTSPAYTSGLRLAGVLQAARVVPRLARRTVRSGFVRRH